MSRLAGKVALVTGTGRGIWKAIALAPEAPVIVGVWSSQGGATIASTMMNAGMANDGRRRTRCSSGKRPGRSKK